MPTNDVRYFSRHIFASVSGTSDERCKIQFQISATDPERPEDDYFEIVEGFYETMRITGILAAGWHASRRMLRAQNATAAAATV